MSEMISTHAVVRGCPQTGSAPSPRSDGQGFGLFLFHSDAQTARLASEAGVTGVIVDWETRGKQARQAGYDTQINRATREDLGRVRSVTAGTVICRINGFGAGTFGEVEAAIAEGADEVLLPMVRSAAQAESVLTQARGRCGVGIMVECQETLDDLESLARLPLARAYIGFNDLHIARRTPHLFTPILDGTVERCRAVFRDIPTGFAGLTLPDKGHPVPCRLLMAEMTRLQCDFSILRRSFLSDTQGQSLPDAIAQIQRALADGKARSLARTQADRDSLYSLIAALSAQPVRTQSLVERIAALSGSAAQQAQQMPARIAALKSRLLPRPASEVVARHP